MTCAKICQMVAKPVNPTSTEQAESAKKAGLLNNMTGTDKEGARKKLGTGIPISSQPSRIDEVVKTEGFRSNIFTQLLGLITNSLDVSDEGTSPPSIHVLQLVLDIVLASCNEELKCARGKEMALALTKNLPNLVKACQSDQANSSVSRSKIVASLRTLASLVHNKREINCGPPSVVATVEEETHGQHHHHHHHHKDKTDPRFICDVHGVPAVRRRCSHGPHKDRRFYVCGLERSNRCNYFKWADAATEAGDGATERLHSAVGHDNTNDIFVQVQMQLEIIFSSNGLEQQLCELFSSLFEKSQSGATVSEATLIHEGASGGASFPSLMTETSKMQDEEDGV